MITDFEKVKKKAQASCASKKNREALLAEQDKVDSDDAAVGQVILLTGETVIDGIDYRMKKGYFIDQALRFMEIQDQLLGLTSDINK